MSHDVFSNKCLVKHKPYFLFLKGKGCDFKYNSVSYWKQSITSKP